MCRVSVIIPTYNRAGLIGQTLDSIWTQSVCDYEVVVVDDGSTDDTAEFLAGVGVSIIYKRIEHVGQGAARNAGLEMAHGEYIAFLDSDDLWESRYLEMMTQALDGDRRLGFVYCDYSTFDDKGIVRACDMAPDHKIGGRLFRSLLESDFISTGAILIRRVCFQNVGKFDPDLPPVEDWDMWLRLGVRYDAGYVDEPLARIRLNVSSPSRNPSIVYPLNLKVLAKLRRDFPDEARRCDPIIRRQEVRFHRALARQFGARHKPLPLLQHVGMMLAARYL
jgi:glycosyltransferase involved in cell wall biosynthesis